MATLLLLLAVSPPQGQATALAPPQDYSCDYLEAHRSLVCYCVRYRMVVTSLASLLNASKGPVESLVLQGCQTVTLKNASTAHLTHPLYQLRVEEVDKVEIEGLEVGPAGLDLSVRGSREGVWVQGPLMGPGNTSLRLSITDCGQLHMAETQVLGLRLLLQTSAVSMIEIVDLSLDLLERNSVEMGESKEIRLEGWRVENVEEGALVVARVAKLEVVDSPILDNSSFQLLVGQHYRSGILASPLLYSTTEQQRQGDHTSGFWSLSSDSWIGFASHVEEKEKEEEVDNRSRRRRKQRRS